MTITPIVHTRLGPSFCSLRISKKDARKAINFARVTAASEPSFDEATWKQPWLRQQLRHRCFTSNFSSRIDWLKGRLWRLLTVFIATKCSKDDRIERCQALPKTANSLTDASQSIAAHGSCSCIMKGRFEFATYVNFSQSYCVPGGVWFLMFPSAHVK